MTALLVIGCILLFLALILCLKLTFVIGYNEEVTLTLRVLFLKLRLVPSNKDKKAGPQSMGEKKAKKIREKLRKKQLKKDAKKQKKAQEKAAKKAAAKEAPKETEKKKMSLPDILDLIALVRKVLDKFIRLFFRHLRIHVARLKIRVAMGDAATTAIAYGAITQAVNVLFPLLEQVRTFSLPKSGEIDVVADFTGDAIEADVEFSFSLRIWHVFHVLFGAIGTAIKHFVKKLIRDAKKKASGSQNGHKPPQKSTKA